jgi:hypothetical protein
VGSASELERRGTKSYATLPKDSARFRLFKNSPDFSGIRIRVNCDQRIVEKYFALPS